MGHTVSPWTAVSEGEACASLPSCLCSGLVSHEMTLASAGPWLHGVTLWDVTCLHLVPSWREPSPSSAAASALSQLILCPVQQLGCRSQGFLGPQKYGGFSLALTQGHTLVSVTAPCLLHLNGSGPPLWYTWETRDTVLSMLSTPRQA